jgi:hypothetical protein
MVKADEHIHGFRMGSDDNCQAPMSRRTKTHDLSTNSPIQKNAKSKATCSLKDPKLVLFDGNEGSEECPLGEELPKRKARKRVLGGQTTNPLLLPLGNSSENVSRERKSPTKSVARSRIVPSIEPVAKECPKMMMCTSGEEVFTKRTRARKVLKNEENCLESRKSNELGDGEENAMQPRQENHSSGKKAITSHLRSQHGSASQEQGSLEAQSLDYNEQGDLDYAQCHKQRSSIQLEEDSNSRLVGRLARVIENQDKKQKGAKAPWKGLSALAECPKSLYSAQDSRSNVQNGMKSLPDQEKDYDSRGCHTPPRESREKATQSQLHEPESDLDGDEKFLDVDGSDSDGMSDFIVNDSYISEEEESIASTPPPPRSRRRLVRGRRPRSIDDSSDVSSQALTLGRSESAVLLMDRRSLQRTSTQLSKLDVAAATERFENNLESTRETVVLNFQALSLNDE